MNPTRYKNKNDSGKCVLIEKDLHLKVKIRYCIEKDLQKLEWFGMFHEHRNIFQKQFQRHLRKENLMLVAELNNFPIGQVWIDLKRFAQDSAALIWALRVHPIMQNQGLGTLLIMKSESIIKSLSYYYAQIDVEKWNIRAKILYERLGYKTFTEEDEEFSFTSPTGKNIDRNLNLFRMKKNLQNQLVSQNM